MAVAVAPDLRLVDHHQVELALQLSRLARDHVEQQLGIRALDPPRGRALLRRLQALHGILNELEGVLDALSELGPHQV